MKTKFWIASLLLLSAQIVNAQLSGTYTINKSQPPSLTNYSSFTSAAQDLKSIGVNGAVVFNVIDSGGVYNEQVQIDTIPGVSSTNTVTINGNGSVLAFNCVDTNKAVLRLNGASYVIIDSLNIKTLNSLYGWGIHLMNGADYNTIRRCNIDISSVNDDNTLNSVGIVASNSFLYPTTSGLCASYLTIENNIINGGQGEGMYYGIRLNGNSTRTGAVANVIQDNVLLNMVGTGIMVYYNEGTLIRRNAVSRPDKVLASSLRGIEIGSGNENVVVSENRIFNTHNAASSQSTFALGVSVSCDASSGNENIVTNNLIYNFNSSYGQAFGIANYSSEGVRYLHNTIVLNDQSASSGDTRGFFLNSSATNVDFINNVIYITRSGSGKKHGIYLDPINSTAVINCDHNVVYMNASGSGSQDYGYWINASINTLTSWKAVNSSKFGQNSLDVDPLFIDEKGYDFTPISPMVDSAGQAIASVLTDFNGKLRNVNFPDPGAFEFDSYDLDAAAIDLGSDSLLCPGTDSIAVWIRNFGVSTIDTITIGWEVNGVVKDSLIRQVNLAIGDSIKLTLDTVQFISGKAYEITVYTAHPNNSPDLNTNNDTLVKSISFGLSGTYTIGNIGDYLSIAAAIEDLHEFGVCGPVIFDIDPASGPYSDLLLINEIRGSSAFNSVTFMGNGSVVNPATGSYSKAAITLNGTDYVIFDSLNVRCEDPNDFYGLLLTNKANYNTVRNCYFDLSKHTSTNSFQGAGILASAAPFSTTAQGNNANYNLFSNNTIDGDTAGMYYGIRLNGSIQGDGCSGNVIENNEISNFHLYGIYLINTQGTVVKGNDIHRLEKTDPGTFYGIYLAQNNHSAQILGNAIHHPHEKSVSAGYSSYGVYLYNCDAPAGSENVVANNSIYKFENSYSTYGLYNLASDSVRFYHNTVSLDEVTSSASGNAGGLYFSGQVNGVVSLNNLFSITRGGSGTKYGLYVTSSSSTIESDYNNYYLNSNGSGAQNTVRFNSTNFTDLTAWKGYAGGQYDQNSVDFSPDFRSVSLDSLMPNSIFLNDKGTYIASVPNDINEEVRNSVSPDIGAFEFTPSLNDAGISSFDGLVNPCPGSVQVTLQNYSTTPLDSVEIHWSINGIMQATVNYTNQLDSGASVQLKVGSISSVSASTYDLVIWTELPNGKADEYHLNDTVSVAGLSAPLSGNYSIGSAGDYTSITAAVSDLNLHGICGPVIFDIDPLSGPYIGRLEIDQIVGCDSANTVTFKGNGAIVNDTANFNIRHVLLLNGTDYFTFDSLKFVCIGPLYGFGVVMTKGADHNTFRNCTIDMTPMTNSGNANGAALVISAVINVMDEEGNNANYNLFEGNLFKGGTVGTYRGISMVGDTDLTGCVGNVFKGNVIQNFHSEHVFMKYNKGTLFSKNEVTRSGKTTIGLFYGIYLQNKNDDILIEKNRIHGTHNNASSTGFDSKGIYLAGVKGGNEGVNIQNNLIYDFNGAGFVRAIQLGSCENVNVLHNTITLDEQGVSSSGATYGIQITGNSSTIDITNNLVNVTRNGIAVKYAIYLDYNGSNVQSDYNNLHLNATGSGAQFIGRYGSVDYLTLATWQGANLSAYDQNSVSAAPMFLNPSNANFTPTNPALNGKSIGLLTVPDDIYDKVRDPLTPDPGAIEFADNVDVWVKSLESPSSGCDLDTNEVISIKVVNNGNVTVQPLILSYSLNNGLLYTDTIVSALQAGDSIIHNFSQKANLLATGSYIIEAFVNLNGDLFPSNDTIMRTIQQRNTPVISIGNDTSLCQGDSIILSAPLGFVNYDWGISTSRSIKVTASGSYDVVATDAFGCMALDTVNVQFLSLPNVDLGVDTSLCENDSLELTGGQGIGNTYIWNTSQTSSSIVASGPKLGPGTYNYYVEVTNMQGCQTTDSIILSFSPRPTLDLGKDSVLCKGDTVVLTAPSAFTTFNWGFASTRSVTIRKSGTVKLVASTTGGCVLEDSVNLTFNSPPGVTLPADTTICNNISLLLSVPNSNNWNYKWNVGDTTSNILIEGSKLAPGIHRFEVTVTDTFGCRSKDNINLTLINAPARKLIDGDTLCERDSVKLDAGSGISYKYLWSNNDTTQITTLYGNNLVQGNNEVIVRVSAPNGCITFDTTVIRIENCVGIEEWPESDLRIYPNPAKEYLYVEIKGQLSLDDCSFSIVDMNGKSITVITTFNVENNTAKLSLQNLPPGTYLLRVISHDKSNVFRFIHSRSH